MKIKKEYKDYIISAFVILLLIASIALPIKLFSKNSNLNSDSNGSSADKTQINVEEIELNLSEMYF